MKKKISIMPKTRIGKISFWLVVLGFVLVYAQYWTAMAFKISIPAPSGMLAMILIIIFGITSMISILKYRDYAILLFLTSLIGILGILFAIGEFLFPH